GKDLKTDHCRVAARTVEACNKTQLNWIRTDHEDDGNGCGRRLCCARHNIATDSDNDGHLPSDQIGSQARQQINLVVRRAVFDGDALALYVPSFLKPSMKSSNSSRRVLNATLLSNPSTGIAVCCARTPLATPLRRRAAR